MLLGCPLLLRGQEGVKGISYGLIVILSSESVIKVLRVGRKRTVPTLVLSIDLTGHCLGARPRDTLK